MSDTYRIFYDHGGWSNKPRDLKHESTDPEEIAAWFVARGKTSHVFRFDGPCFILELREGYRIYGEKLTVWIQENRVKEGSQP